MLYSNGHYKNTKEKLKLFFNIIIPKWFKDGVDIKNSFIVWIKCVHNLHRLYMYKICIIIFILVIYGTRDIFEIEIIFQK
jgi:hypothetical protein